MPIKEYKKTTEEYEQYREKRLRELQAEAFEYLKTLEVVRDGYKMYTRVKKVV